MRFDLITIFPHILDSYFNESILGRARKKKLINIKIHNLRAVTLDRHHTVDDRPFGGGVGMLFKIEPLYQTLKKIKRLKKSKIILLDPSGTPLTQKKVVALSKLNQIILIAGRYEGLDARLQKFIDEKISLGPYVLAGGELPAAVIVESVARLLPGVLGKDESSHVESHSTENYLEYPQYTRPAVFTYKEKGQTKKLIVPKVLLSGNHKKIGEWQQKNYKFKIQI